MIGGVGETLPEAVRCKGNELRFRINQIHLLRACLLLTKARSGFRHVFMRLDTVQNVLRLCLVVNACRVAPTVRGKEKRGNIVELAIAGSTFGIMATVSLAAPGKVTATRAVLVLHVLLAPSPQAVEHIFLV